MLSPKTQYSLTNAKQYFEEHLCTGDYYSEGERIAGQWFGKGAELLELSGNVGRDEFLRLCDNLDPHTGQRLTQRLKTTRTELGDDGESHSVANRRVFYDFTFSPPKSVSIAALVGDDARIVKAHHQAVLVALQELERFAATRVHTGKGISDRNTGNLVAALFRHDTSRALDPHLHSHCILSNATHDPVENRWKALQNFEMLHARKYVESVYYHHLASALRQFGYDLENKPRGDFEIKDVAPTLCERFSKRHREIDEKTQELLARKPHLASGNLNELRESIARNERSRKIKGVQPDALRALWASQLTGPEQETLAGLKNGATLRPDNGDAEQAVQWAEEHLFDRRSVVPEYEIWRHALEHARGQSISLSELREVTLSRKYIRSECNTFEVASRSALDREWDIVCLARDGRGQHDSLGRNITGSNPRLATDQRKAVEHILSSRDFATLFRGGAGTGKSFALREVRSELQHAGHTVLVIAPQRQQVIDLERDGFAGAQTVSEFLAKQAMTRGAVVIVDEAGQIGAKQMQLLLHCVRDNGGRIILSGDTRQHGAVEASDALWAIEKYSGVFPAELQEIRRQDPARARTAAERAQITEYKQAVKEASEGKFADSFRRLDRLGVIEECSPFDQQQRLAEQFLALVEQQQHSVVVVSQTWSEIHKVNDQVRAALKSRGLLGAEERSVTAFEPVDLTDAQKRDRRFYTTESVVVLNRNAGGFRRGETARLVTITGAGLILEGSNKVRTVPFRFADRLTVCQRKELALACGDRLQLKANGHTRQGGRLANGELVTVAKVLADGRITLRDGRVLEKDYRQFVRGFAITSYASQGKTVDHVLFSDSAIKPATNRQQWYVTISRGRKGLKIFTSDKAQLRENILRSGDRPLALDLANKEFVQRLGIPWSLVGGCPQPLVLALALSRRIRDFIASRRAPAIQQRRSVEVAL